MSLSIDRFDEFFREAVRNEQGKTYDPFPWQTRLARQVFNEGWPDCIDLPTASGKTAAIDIAVFVLACQAGLETNQRTVGRRIFFTVNRRVIVDEAFERAKKLAQKLLDAKDGILKEVANALYEISGDKDAPPLDIAQLRGGIYRDRAWARSITQPIVVCTTADQLGSRLLFRGYGVTDSSAPIHAALCGCDSLILLDEAHVTRAFSQTMQLLTRYQQVRTSETTTIPPMRFVQMTATPADVPEDKRFNLKQENWNDPRNMKLKERQEASKPAKLIDLKKKKSIVDDVVEFAQSTKPDGALSTGRKAVGIIVNRVKTARDIYEALVKEHGENVYLIIGRMRPIDRDKLQGELRDLVGPGRPEVFPTEAKPVFIVATQCLEVGADYDFDALITECASIDALRQRFGRLNRKGRKNPDGSPFEIFAAIVTNEESLKGDDPIYGDAIKHTWEWLWSKKDTNGAVDFGIFNFKPLWQGVESDHATYLDEDAPKRLLSPTQSAAVLLPAHLDTLCQTAPYPEPSPDVSYFIHGPQRDNAEVNVCWRADLCDDPDQWPDIIRLLPPTSTECMTVPLRDLRRWMNETKSKDDRDADVPVQADPDEKRPDSPDQTRRSVVVWRGTKEIKVIDSANELRPNDTVVMPIEYQNWNALGHIPELKPIDHQKQDDESDEAYEARRLHLWRFQLNRAIDVAERATRESKLRVIVRIHPAFENIDSLRGLSDPDLRLALVDRGIIPSEWNKKPLARIERHSYRDSDDDNPDSKPDEVIVFKRLLDPPNKLVLPAIDEDDGEDDLSEGNKFIPLDDHTKHVEERLAAALGKLHLGEIESTTRASAPLHDIGKSDARFQAMLAGITPYEAMMLPKLLGKGDGVRRTQVERNAIFERAMYPRGFRHEMLSIELIEHIKLETDLKHRDLLLHLIAAHHGYARPFAPVCFDEAIDDELRSVHVNGKNITGSERKAWTPSHRFDSGVAERFWKLTREHGWWGLAWLESILRLADQQASAAEQEGKNND
ncbi:MAG TPA: type I-U CRISPR-associated helicase/endonuclease Cas3 [Tepidisphaeraceae bacterium]|nr:type I-U CRISPR-associated helicase/endonuclease Cas3 [Tepidisphaeraceae bacterium]